MLVDAPGDVLGCGIDLDRREIMYWLNGTSFPSIVRFTLTAVQCMDFAGEYMGVAFTGVKPRDGLYAGISIETQVRCAVNFGAEPFKYPPHPAAPASPSLRGMELDDAPCTSTSSSSETTSISSCSPSTSFLASWRPLQYDTVFGLSSPFRYVLVTGTSGRDALCVESRLIFFSNIFVKASQCYIKQLFSVFLMSLSCS